LKLAVVIIHYNSSADLDKCLASLAACAPAVEHRVVVVDNASVDKGLDEVHRNHPDCLWIFNKENVGYARGCNRGMAQVDAEYYLILNPDIVVQPGALDRLLDFADAHPRAGVVGPQLLNTDGSIQNSCRRFYTLKTLLLRRTILGRIFPDSRTVHLHLMDDFDHQTSRPVDWILGGCMLARRSAMERTGPMDERFFLYFEDVDWCYRMWQAGFEVQYTPDARFVHHHRRDSAAGKFSKSFWFHLGSLISFYEKWGMFVWLMKKWRDPLLVFLLWTLDMAGLTAAFGLAYALRGAMGGLFAEPLYPVAEYMPLLMFSWLLASLTFLLTGRYRPDRPGRHRGARSLPEHLQQIGVVAVLLLASTYLGHLEVISRAVLLMFIPLLAVMTAAGEGMFRRILRLSLIHISEPTRRRGISYAVFLSRDAFPWSGPSCRASPAGSGTGWLGPAIWRIRGWMWPATWPADLTARDCRPWVVAIFPGSAPRSRFSKWFSATGSRRSCSGTGPPRATPPGRLWPLYDACGSGSDGMWMMCGCWRPEPGPRCSAGS